MSKLRIALYGTLLLYAVAAVVGAAHARESWQDRPNPYNQSGYDADGGYRGESENNTWGRDFTTRENDRAKKTRLQNRQGHAQPRHTSPPNSGDRGRDVQRRGDRAGCYAPCEPVRKR